MDGHEIQRYRTHLMGIAALWIYIFHEWVPLAPGIPVLGFLEGFIKQIGFFGVDIFFLLSGMGLIRAIETHSALTFYKRRFLRILPPYALMALVIAAVNQWSVSQFLKNLFGITFFTENIYALLWFVPAIAIFYLVFPLYYAAFRRVSGQATFTGCVMLLWLIASLLAAEHMRLDLFGFTNRIPIFLTGILIGWLLKEKPRRTPKPLWLVLFVLFAVGLVTAYATNYRGIYILVPVSNCCVPNFLMAFSGVFLLARGLHLIALYTKGFGKILLKLLHFFGTISLEFYCVQELVGERLKTLLIGITPDSVTNAILLFCVTLSALVLRFVCVGIQKAGRRVVNARRKE